MSDKRLAVTECPVCGATILRDQRHTAADDLRQIIERDAAYDRAGRLGEMRFPLTEQVSGRMQMAADRRMLLRFIDALPEPAVAERETT